MIQPVRIQLSRQRGFRLQEVSLALNGLPAVKVDRTTQWGNPYYDIRRYGLDLSLRLFEETAQGVWNPMLIPDNPHDWVKW